MLLDARRTPAERLLTVEAQHGGRGGMLLQDLDRCPDGAVALGDALGCAALARRPFRARSRLVKPEARVHSFV